MTLHISSDLDSTNLIMDLVSARQKALSSNIANVNTPGYVRQEVNFEEYLDTINKPLETKLSKKMGPNPLMQEQGDTVSLAEELVAMQKNSLLYSIASRRATMIIQELKSVTQVGR